MAAVAQSSHCVKIFEKVCSTSQRCRWSLMITKWLLLRVLKWCYRPKAVLSLSGIRRLIHNMTYVIFKFMNLSIYKMFSDKIPPIQQNKKIIQISNSTRYARLNWTHHLKPLIGKSFADFYQRLQENGYREKPFFNCLSDSIEDGEDINASKDIYGDSISIQYGGRPVPIAPTYVKGGGRRVLVEDGASLVFSLNVNGSVVAFIYPQRSDISKTKQKYYMIGEWRNSADISASDIRKMLEFLFEIQTYCGIYYSGKISSWLLTKLNAKDESIRGGTNPMLRYFKYLGHLINGVRKLYGMGSPSP